MNNLILKAEYCRILTDLDPSYFDPAHPQSKVAEGLSGIFLPGVTDNYRVANNRIMIVGRETRGWKVLDKTGFSDTHSYVDQAVSKHALSFAAKMKPKRDRGCSFFNFMRAVGRKAGTDGLIWSNLFCFDSKKSTPARSPHIDAIASVSADLLRAQIRVLSPHMIIFANGRSSVGYRKRFFPMDGVHKVCFNGKNYEARGVPQNQLWGFDLFDRIPCLRIHHPSAPSHAARDARELLIDLLPSG